MKQSKNVFFVLFWSKNFINKRVTLNKLKQVLNHIKIKDWDESYITNKPEKVKTSD